MDSFHLRPATIYCFLSRNGENHAPVCGEPFYDPYFKCVRTWETLEERSQAILSHQSLLEMVDM